MERHQLRLPCIEKLNVSIGILIVNILRDVFALIHKKKHDMVKDNQQNGCDYGRIQCLKPGTLASTS